MMNIMRILAAGVLVLAAGCSRQSTGQSAPDNKATEPTPVVKVATIQPQRGDLRRAVSQPGFILAYEETPVFAKLEAYVRKWNFDIGAEVNKGAVLAELYIPEMDVELAQKKALARKAHANLASAEAKVKAAQAGVLRAKANLKQWALEQARQNRLFKQGTLDQQSLDVVNAQWETALAAVAEAQAEADKAEADVDVAQNDIEVAEANRDYVATLLQYAKVRAPFAGRVTRRNVDTGHFVRPAKGVDEKPLFAVERTDLLRIAVAVPEADAVWVRRGATVIIRIPSLQDVEISGKVDRTSWALERTARTLRAEIDMKNPGGQLRPNTYAYVTITGVRAGVWTLPASAVATEGDVTQGYRSYCYLVKGGKVWRTLVQVGARAGELIEVLKIQPRTAEPGKAAAWHDVTGKEVIVRGDLGSLRDGQTVIVANKR
jgi:multidrug efflux pump subunit AcrA (membrane-fusion protein)